MSSPIKKSTIKKVTPKKIDLRKILMEYVSKKSVTIILDDDKNSDLANMGSCYSYQKNDKILVICAPLLAEQDNNLLLDIIRYVHDDGDLLWKSSKKDILQNYREYAAENSSDKNILQFFSGILPKDDYSALKMSLYLRFKSNQGKDISVFRKDIRDRFGERGTNISNLCSAGYFEEFQKIYNEVSKEDFNDYYEIAVGKKARALFVNMHMSEENIMTEFQKMLNKALKYHINEFRIHGKGASNVSNIRTFVKNLNPTTDDNYTIKKVYDDERFAAVEYLVELSLK